MNWVADLEIYRIARELSKEAWNIYKDMSFDIQKIIGHQFVRSTDSVWANIAEWFWRFHYLDSIKFYYNARWSLQETKHRIELLYDREVLSNPIYKNTLERLEILSVKLNNFIRAAKKNITKN